MRAPDAPLATRSTSLAFPCLPLPTPGTKTPLRAPRRVLKKRRAPARRARTTPEKGETAAETPARRTAQRTQHNAHSTVRCASTEAQEHEGGARTQERREPPAAARHSSETKTAAAGRFFRMEFLCRKKTLHEAVEGALRPQKRRRCAASSVGSRSQQIRKKEDSTEITAGSLVKEPARLTSMKFRRPNASTTVATLVSTFMVYKSRSLPKHPFPLENKEKSRDNCALMRDRRTFSGASF